MNNFRGGLIACLIGVIPLATMAFFKDYIRTLPVDIVFGLVVLSFIALPAFTIFLFVRKIRRILLNKKLGGGV